jgi:hypothetical protein
MTAFHSNHNAQSPWSSHYTKNIIHQLSHLGTVNYHNPDLFETIGNHSHVRSLELSWSQGTYNRKVKPLMKQKYTNFKIFGQLTLLTEREKQLLGHDETKTT